MVSQVRNTPVSFDRMELRDWDVWQCLQNVLLNVTRVIRVSGSFEA